ncbi:unnamed protein product, partial [Laminaria digitata]
LLLFSSVCDGLVKTCEELQAAFDLTKTQDVVIEMHPFEDINCGTFTTMSMDSHSLLVESSEDLKHYSGHLNLHQVRFEVTNGATLIWETNVEFNGPTGEDVNGGGMFVGEGSTVRFLNDLMMTDVGVTSVTDESSDFASIQRSGGCVYTDGSFTVDGHATFTHCDVTGGGESPPGPGGALYVGTSGSVLFNDELEISGVFLTDDYGGNGGGIYNAGKVDIKANAKFESIVARDGAALYNAAGAEFRFTNQATALFIDCTSDDGQGSALYNWGNFEFSGPALFVDVVDPVIYVSSTGVTVLSENSVFWGNEYAYRGVVLVASGGQLDVPSSVSFI